MKSKQSQTTSESTDRAIYYQHRVFIAAVRAHQIMQATEGRAIRRWAMACRRHDQLVRMLIAADIAVGDAGPSLYRAFQNYRDDPEHARSTLRDVCGLLPKVPQAFARKRVEVKRHAAALEAAS